MANADEAQVGSERGRALWVACLEPCSVDTERRRGQWFWQGCRWVRSFGLGRPPAGLSGKERCFDAYRGVRIGEATNPSPSFHDDADSVVDREYWPDPELQWALEDGAERGGEPLLSGELSRPPAPPELEEAALRAQARLQGEIVRLRRQGIPAEHTWSAVLVSTIWLSLPVYCH